MSSKCCSMAVVSLSPPSFALALRSVRSPPAIDGMQGVPSVFEYESADAWIPARLQDLYLKAAKFRAVCGFDLIQSQMHNVVMQRRTDADQRKGRESPKGHAMNEIINAVQTRRLVLRLMAMAPAAAMAPPALHAQSSTITGSTTSTAAAADDTTFSDVWQTVRDRFYDPQLHRLDWAAVGDRYRSTAGQAASDEELATIINSMLSELHASHTHYYTKDEPEYYQLAGIFAGALRRRGLERVFPGGRISYPGIGILSTKDAEGKGIVTGVIDGTPGHQAGLLVGDEIITVDGASFQPVQSFRGKVADQVTLAVHRAGSKLEVPVKPIDIEPNKMFLDGMISSAHILEANGRRIGYVHVWCYAGYAYQRALEDLLSEGALRDADALIWDLRDGWGGAVPEYLDLFNTRAPTMQVVDRGGAREIENVKWRKPVAMLVNGGTRSARRYLHMGLRNTG